MKAPRKPASTRRPKISNWSPVDTVIAAHPEMKMVAFPISHFPLHVSCKQRAPPSRDGGAKTTPRYHPDCRPKAAALGVAVTGAVPSPANPSRLRSGSPARLRSEFRRLLAGFHLPPAL